MAYKTMLDRILAEYPEFIDKSSDSNIHAYENVLAGEYKKLETNAYLVELSKNLDRPIKLWKSQAIASNYTIEYLVNLENIKRVKLSKEVIENKAELNVATCTNALGNTTGLTGRTTNTISSSTDVAKFGTRSVRINPSGASNDTSVGIGGDTGGLRAGMLPGHTYTFGGWVYVPENTWNDPNKSGYLGRILVFHKVGASYTSSGSATLTKYGDWVWQQVTKTISPDATEAFVRYYGGGKATDSYVYWGGMVMVEGTTISKGDIDLLTGNLILDTPQLLQDSGILDEGIDTYSNSYSDTCPSVAPESKYSLEVEDYQENVFHKGFPENDSPQGNKYDHDEALDIIGDLLDIPRRTHVTVADADLPDTFPPYCNSGTEWDYTYEQRIKRHMETVDEDPLPKIELEKLFEISPNLAGRWHYLCRQNLDYQDQMFMLTPNWHPSVLDVLVNLSNVPSNIALPSGSLIDDILNKTSPLCKKALFQFISSEALDEEVVALQEYISFSNKISQDQEVIADILSITTTFENDEAVGIVESMQPNLRYDMEGVGFIENIMRTTHGLEASYDSGTELNEGVMGDDTYVEGEGATAKVRIDTDTKTVQKYPTTMGVNSSDNCDDYGWSYYERIGANDGNYTYSNSGGVGWTQWVRGGTFRFGIPTNAQVLGLAMQAKHSCNASLHYFNYKLWCGGNEAVFRYPSTTPYGSGSSTTYTGVMEWLIGGNGNNLGIAWNVLTPANVNAMMAGVAVSFNASGKTAYVDYVRITAYWRYKTGAYITPVISAPAGADSWDEIVIDHTIDTGTSITYQVLDASDDSVLLETTDSTIDISGLAFVDIKIKASMTANGATTPYINSIKVYSLKEE